jgi:DNA-binding NarL/FixJ family response regulator
MISRVDETHWLPWLMLSRDGDVIGEPSEVHPCPMSRRDDTIESEILDDLSSDRAGQARRHGDVPEQLRAVFDSSSYAVAAIYPAGRPIGLVHADHGSTDRLVDTVDEQALSILAQAISRLFERTAARERLHQRQRTMHSMLQRMEATMAEITATGGNLVAASLPLTSNAGDTLDQTASSGPPERQLTPREREILGLVVLGQSNHLIAQALVIAEETVKGHVKHILRKFGVANRSQLISAVMSRRTDGQ